MINPYSIFDSLFIGKKIQGNIGDFNYSELQLFCYFSCLMSLYDGNPISFWGYKFIKNELGVPLSYEVDVAIEKLQQNNELILKDDGFLRLTDLGEEKLKTFTDFDIYKSRIKYLQASCESLLVMPIGNFRTSIYQEPLIKFANEGDLRNLTEEDSIALDSLYDQFEMLKEALKNQYSDLFVPAVTWLKYLQNSESFNV